MITDAEIRRLARSEHVEPRIVELDYALGWALRGIAKHRYLSGCLVFKGGTCLRKCYFPAYRSIFGYESRGSGSLTMSTVAKASGLPSTGEVPTHSTVPRVAFDLTSPGTKSWLSTRSSAPSFTPFRTLPISEMSGCRATRWKK